MPRNSGANNGIQLPEIPVAAGLPAKESAQPTSSWILRGQCSSRPDRLRVDLCIAPNPWNTILHRKGNVVCSQRNQQPVLRCCSNLDPFNFCDRVNVVVPVSVPVCAVFASGQNVTQSEFRLHLRRVQHCLNQLGPFGVVQLWHHSLVSQ